MVLTRKNERAYGLMLNCYRAVLALIPITLVVGVACSIMTLIIIGLTLLFVAVMLGPDAPYTLSRWCSRIDYIEDENE